MKENNKCKKGIGKIAKALGFIVTSLLAVLVIYVFIVKVTGGIPSFFGYRLLTIATPSMEPKLPVDSYIVIKNCDANELEKDDIITFYSKDPSIYGKPNTHRIHAIEEIDGKRVFTTKGDNNRDVDNYKVEESDIIGVYAFRATIIEAIGSVFHDKWLFLFIIVLPLALILIAEFVSFSKKFKTVKKEEDEMRIKELKNAAIEEYKRESERKDEADSDGRDDSKPE